jgi:hypothetical protein
MPLPQTNRGKCIKDTYVLQSPGHIILESQASIVSFSHSKVAKIEFNTSPPAKPEAKTRVRQFDRLFLKNGDNLSGQVLTRMFKLRSVYGTFDIQMADISYIEFDGRGKDVDVVGLKVGDVLSGKVEVESVKLLSRSGKEVTLQTGEIRRISFKK